MQQLKENWQYIVIAALLGTGGGTAGTSIFGQHGHPELLYQIRKIQYESEVFKINADIYAMEAAGETATARYRAASDLLSKYQTMLADLEAPK